MNKIAIASALLLTAGLALQPTSAEQRVIGGGTTETCKADVLDASNDPKTGVADCTDALQFQPMSLSDRISTTVNRGTLRSRAGDLNGAYADFSDAISMNPRYGQAYLDRSATLLGLKRYTQAKADADMAIQYNARPAEVAYYNRAAAEEGLGDIQAAYHDYKMAVQLQPNFTAAKNELARFKVTSGGGTGNGGAM
jgi:tetratricopeptide (TPR) repeat protein